MRARLPLDWLGRVVGRVLGAVAGQRQEDIVERRLANDERRRLEVLGVECTHDVEQRPARRRST